MAEQRKFNESIIGPGKGKSGAAHRVKLDLVETLADQTGNPELVGENSRRRRSVLSGDSCSVCKGELAAIEIDADGEPLVMESCAGCDTRRWRIADQRLELQQALDVVGEHSGRR